MTNNKQIKKGEKWRLSAADLNNLNHKQSIEYIKSQITYDNLLKEKLFNNANKKQQKYILFINNIKKPLEKRIEEKDQTVDLLEVKAAYLNNKKFLKTLSNYESKYRTILRRIAKNEQLLKTLTNFNESTYNKLLKNHIEKYEEQNKNSV